ncbi:MAG: DUF6493 family protein [Candidatus Obscuribacterales bacterium]|nr:DUF6493 family protein [Candidatus Obscuribacterales bacterium]
MLLSPLDEIILAADIESCASFFETMPESQRKSNSARALQWASAINGYMCRNRKPYMVFDKAMAENINFYESIQAHTVAFPRNFTESSLPAAQMSVLATCALPELKKAGWLGLPEAHLATRILQARKPSWLSKWCSYALKEFPATHWLTIYEIEKCGLCKVERDANFWMSMLCSLPNIVDMYQTILASDEQIRMQIWDMLADPDVIRMLAEPEQVAHDLFRKRWRSGGNIFAPKQIGSRKGTEVWHDTLIKLASEGLIDRNRLIDYSFTLLVGVAEREHKKTYYSVSAADFAIKLNRELIKEQTASFTDQFTSLLGATHKDVSTYASTVLTAIPSSSLKVEEICSCIEPAFLNKSKEPADAALKLLSRLAKEQPSQANDYGKAMLAALNHSSKDIHRKALALIDSTKILKEENLFSEFRERVDMLAGMERAQAEKLVADYETSGSTSREVISKSPGAAKVEDLFARAGALDQRLCELVRIDDTIQAIKANRFIDNPINLDNLDFPRLNPDAVLKPIDNLDDLIYTFMKVWSGKRDAIELESVLDGVSRLCHERPPEFKSKTEALREKANKSLQDHLAFGLANGLTQLAEAWLGDWSNVRPPAQPGSFFSRRCLALSKRVSSRISAPLLAAPTHAGGWIDPVIFVQRLKQYFWLKIEPDAADTIQSLLRLAPDNREEALLAAEPIKHEIGDVVRYALGGAQPVRMVTPEYWVAAFRAREPLGLNKDLLKLIPHAGPDAAVPATYDIDMAPVEHFATDRYASIGLGLPNFLPVHSLDPNFPGTFETRKLPTMEAHAALSGNRSRYAFYPTVLLHDNANNWFAGNDTYNWLHNRESLLALYAKRVLLNIDSIGSYWRGDFEFLFDPDISMCGNGRYLLCLAMSSKSSDLARLGLDALIAAVGERRIGADSFGEAMALFIKTGVITAVRWTRGLRDSSRTSSLHAHFAWQAVCTMLTKAQLTSTQQIPFLELLLEIQLEHKFKPDEAFVSSLSGSTASGKGQKLFKGLIASPGIENSNLSTAYVDLESKIQRVERWQQWLRVLEPETVK